MVDMVDLKSIVLIYVRVRISSPVPLGFTLVLFFPKTQPVQVCTDYAKSWSLRQSLSLKD